MTGADPNDQLIDSALWLDVQGDRAGAIDLLKRVLRSDPSNERAGLMLQKYGEAPPGLTRKAPAPTRRFAAPTREELEEMRLEALGESLDVPLGDEDLVVPPRPSISGKRPAFTPPPPPQKEPALAGQRAWSLEVLNGPHTGHVLPLARRPLVIGMGLGVLDVDSDPFMSAGHASFFQRGNDLWVSDGASASGTWVSFEGPQRLNPLDSFSVGLQRLRYLGVLDNGTVDQPWPYGAPRPAASWRLEHTLLGARQGRVWLLRGVATLGRRNSTIDFADDETLDNVHAELRPAGQTLELLDRSGAKNTFIALPPGGERRLVEGTKVRLGSTLFRVTAR